MVVIDEILSQALELQAEEVFMSTAPVAPVSSISLEGSTANFIVENDVLAALCEPTMRHE